MNWAKLRIMKRIREKGKNNLFIFSLALLFNVLVLTSFSNQIPHSGVHELKTIVLDAGHGGKDPGCNGANEIWEKEVTLKVVKKLGKLIEDSLRDVRVLYTRKTDVFINLWERPKLANKNNADLFVSIHCNSINSTSPNGSETYFMGLHKKDGNIDVAKRENEAVKFEEDYKSNAEYGGFDPNSPESEIIFTLVQNAHMSESSKFSSLVEKKSPSFTKIRSRGVKQAGFLVLWQASMPSVLVELGFLTNKEDRKILKSDAGQNNAARGIFSAICDYKKNKS
jgi:N-acetylmuramoyl-L-alanine amidase